MIAPVFAHGHLRLYLLSLLAGSERGMHGYELMQALSDRFGGTYVPSAGTIYPRLAKLEDEGLVSKLADGRKTVYEITDAGRAEVAERESELTSIEDDVTDSVRRLADEVRSSVNFAMRSLRADLAAATREARVDARSESRAARAENFGPSGNTRMHLHEAEALLSNFRNSLRSELRIHIARADLSAETVERLRSGLEDLRKSVLSSL